MKRKLLIGLFALAVMNECDAQVPAQSREFMPQVLPGSPEAASFAKFGNYQVNLFTGLPEISIPLYEIKVGEISVPISISYHASGIKVNDWGSWVGLGWNLNAGGGVSRKIMGLPDDMPGNYLSGSHPVRDVSTIDPSTEADLYYIRNVLQGNIDGEPDIFSYNFPGKSGQFVFNQNDSYKPILIPYDPVSINFSSGAFDIKDEGGKTFQFHEYETSQFVDIGKTTQGKSTWMLSKIFSANNQDSVTFSYSQRYGQVSSDFRDIVILNDLVNNIGLTPNYAYDAGLSYTDNLSTFVDERKISQIGFPNGKVVFDASSSDRLDAFTGQKSLTDIQVYSWDVKSASFVLLKSVNFYQSYFINSGDSNIKRLRLDSLTINDNTGAVIEKYKFNYNTSVELPDKVSSRARDYWGYYNGKSNDLLVPQITGVSYQPSAGSSPGSITVGSTIPNGREPDPAYMQAYMLQRIDFPTGGHTDFEYETNQYLELPSTVKYAGGLRIKSIKSYDGSNPNPVVKTYKYGGGESGYGTANFKLANYFFQTTQNNQYFSYQALGCDLLTDTKRVRTFVSSPSVEMESYDGSPVSYDTVTEYVGDPTTNIGKTIFIFNDHPDELNTSIVTGKPVLTTYYEHRGQLLDKQVFKNTGGGSYQIVEEEKNIYTAFPEHFEPNLGIVVVKHLITDNYIAGDIALPASEDQGACNHNDSHNFQYVNYDIRTDDNKLIQTAHYAYDQNDPSKAVVTTTNYTYNNLANLQVSKASTINSLGDTIDILKKYPHDFPSTSPYDQMITQNIINKVVTEQKVKNTSQTLTLQTNNYVDAGNGNFLTGNITYQVSSNPAETRANFNAYDIRGNILEMQKTNDIKQSYLWDYQKFYPVAEVKNAAQNQIAFTSFESDGTGNWSILNPIPTPEGFTGSQGFILNSTNNISYYFANAGVNFVLSYWSKDGQLSVGGVTTVSTVTGVTKNGWTYYEHIISPATGNTVTLTAASAKTIDELRLYPASALMKTYTFLPLIGMSSQCSENNIVTYYIYDKYNRLKFLKDTDGNILKTMEYHYQGNSNTGL